MEASMSRRWRSRGVRRYSLRAQGSSSIADYVYSGPTPTNSPHTLTAPHCFWFSALYCTDSVWIFVRRSGYRINFKCWLAINEEPWASIGYYFLSELETQLDYACISRICYPSSVAYKKNHVAASQSVRTCLHKKLSLPNMRITIGRMIGFAFSFRHKWWWENRRSLRCVMR